MLGCDRVDNLECLARQARCLVMKVLGRGGTFAAATRAMCAGISLLVAHTGLRMLWKIVCYRWQARKCRHLPWIWENGDAAVSEGPYFFRFMPTMMKASSSKGLSEYFRLQRDASTGNLRPVVYAGASAGFDPMVILNDSKYFGEMLTDLDQYPKYSTLYQLFEAVVGKGLVASAGEHHKKQRKIITPVFHFAALKSAMEVVERNALTFVRDELPAAKFIIAQDTFKRFTLDVIIDYAFSGQFDKQWMRKAWHAVLQAFVPVSVMRIFISDYIKYLPNPCNCYVMLVQCKIRAYLRKRRAFLQQHNMTEAVLLEFLQKSVESWQTDSAATPAPAAHPQAQATVGDGPIISIDLGMNLADRLILAGCPTSRIVDECCSFLFAGHDTTSNLLAWASHELSRHPAEQALVRDELARVLGPGPVTSVTYEAMKRLDYTHAALKETLRLWPPVPIATRSNLAPALSVAGHAIPRGAVLDVCLYSAHRDPAIWPDPDEFRPARWLVPADSDEARRRHAYAYLPFLAGPRNCIGQKFALQEAAVAAAVLLSRYRLEPADPAGPPVVPVIVGTMEPRNLRVRCLPLPTTPDKPS